MKEIQERIADLYKLRGFTDDLLTLALGLCEEAGEVGKAVNAYHNPHYKLASKSHPDTAEHELVDVLMYAFGIASVLGVDLLKIASDRLDAVEQHVERTESTPLT